MSTAALARRLLTADAAGQVVSHEIGEPVFEGGPMRYVRFLTSPKPIGNELCRRQVLYVDLQPVGSRTPEKMRTDAPVKFESLTDYFEVVAAPQCGLEPEALFAQPQPRGSFDRAVEGLRTLIKLQDRARSGAPMQARLSCTNEAKGDGCAGDARQVLAGLPTHRIYIIESKKSGWQFAISPRVPGEFIWDVELTTNAAGPPTVEMTWKRPAPF